MKKSIKLDRKIVNILGIKVDSTTTSKVLVRVNNFLSHNTKFYITTPNPELVLMAQENNELKEAMNNSSIAIADGIGLKLADPSLKIIKGRELFLDLIDLLDVKSGKAFFLGGKEDEAKRAQEVLSKKFKKIKIESFRGPILNSDLTPVTEVDIKLQNDAVTRINKFSPDILFIAMENPKQEIWIHKNISKLNVRGAMSVGGTFRYVSGYASLPPKLFSSFGFEWLWRVIKEPFRIKRIINALVKFPFSLLISKL